VRNEKPESEMVRVFCLGIQRSKKMKLYRFEKNETDRLETIEKGELYFSKPDIFNDAKDCSIDLIFNLPLDFNSYDTIKACSALLFENHTEYKKLPPKLKELVANYLSSMNPKKNKGGFGPSPHINAISKYLRNTTGVCCFFSKPPLHPLMWAHYGDGHKGFCVEYEVEARDDNLFSVNYSNHPGIFWLSELALCPYETVMRILSTKSMEWSYESEFRLLHLEKFNNEAEYSGTRDQLPPSFKASRIILGERFKLQTNKETLEKINLPIDDYQTFKNEI
jgi:hypothetical protein